MLVLASGSMIAAWHYPGGFDWLYTVASALGSQKDNPTGSMWFAGGLSLSMILLWPYVSALKKGLWPSLPGAGGFAIGALLTSQIGVPAGVALWSVLLGLGVSSAVGVFFGVYPAMKAARLDPIEALRYE